ncbi:MAG: glycoside hydrolase family 28 protein [Bacteroidota bacterium]
MRLLFSICFLSFMLSSSATDYNVLDYGAKPDGTTLCTEQIQAAINAAYRRGGGRVVIPKGRFLSGSIYLKSKIELHLEEGAILQGSVNADHYERLGLWKALLLSDGQHDIALSGPGALDGNGRAVALRLDSLFYAGALDSAHYNFADRRPKFYTRPTLIQFLNCQHVDVRNLTLRRAACWVQSYQQCEDLTIDNIRVESDTYWNNDGIDIVDCQEVRLTNSYFNCSDDGICIKSHFANLIGENIFINNCTVRSSASAIKFGTNSLGGFRNVTIKNIKVFDTFRSAIAIESVDGGVLENITIDSVEATNTGNAIFIKLGHRVKGDVATLKNVTIQNVKVEVPFGRPDHAYELRGPDLPFFHNVFPSSITGFPGHYVENVVLKNIEITFPGKGNKGLAYRPLSDLDQIPEKENVYPEFSMFGELPAWGFYVRHVKGLVFQNISLNLQAPDHRPTFVFDDVHGLDMREVQVLGESKEKKVILRNTSDTKIEDSAWIQEIK